MRITIFIPMLFLTACTAGVGQRMSEEAEREREFQELIKKAKVTQIKNEAYIKAADEQTTKSLEKASETIVALKQEVTTLKIELNEVSPPSTVDIKYDLLPLADSTDY